tara:strand:+ start:108 stop:509 length:402 start_codon:yes stop_codon:yes gene_type:complete
MTKSYIFSPLILFSLLLGIEKPFLIEVRPRLVDGAKVIVNVEVENSLKKPIEYLEGFISEFNGEQNLINEKKVILLHEYEPPLQSGFRATKSLIYPLNKKKPHNYKFRVSKVKYMGDLRIYTWHKKVGLIRID